MLIDCGRGLVFNPHHEMEAQIRAAADSIADVFSEIDSALDKGQSVTGAVRKQKLDATVMRIVSSARLHGFLRGAQHSRKHMPVMYGRDIRSAGEARAQKVNKFMRRTSRNVLKNTPDSDYVLSGDRALMAARFEAANSYFQGVQDSFAGVQGWKKRWVTSSAEACPECEENEGQGLIGTDEDFQSGHSYPLAHQNCSCACEVRRV
jgi:hypothetical protein